MAASPRVLPLTPPAATARGVVPSGAAHTPEVTQPLELEHVLEVSKARGPSVVVDEPEPFEPNAEMTQQIRLDQILTVADQRRRTLSVPPPNAEPEQAVQGVVSATTAGSEDEEAEDAQALVVDITSDPPSRTIDLEVSDALPSIAVPVGRAPDTTLPEVDGKVPADAAPASLSNLLEGVIDDEPNHGPFAHAPRADPTKRPNQGARSAHATLVGMPRVVAPLEVAAVARGGEVPQAMPADADVTRRGSQRLAVDARQRVAPRDTAPAISAAQPMERERHRPGDASQPFGESRHARTATLAAVAVVLLGVFSFGVSRLFGGDTPAAAKPDGTPGSTAAVTPAVGDESPRAMPRPAPPKAKPVTAIAAQPVAEPTAPAVDEAAKGDGEPPPTTAQGQPAGADPARAEAQPTTEASLEPRGRGDVASQPERTSTSEARSDRGEHRGSSGSRKAETVVNEASWAKARDEARAHYAARHYRKAAEAYALAAKYNPTNAGTYAGLGGARLNTGDTRGAIQAYQRAAQLSPSTSGFHAALGRAYLTHGDKAKARASYERALALDPSNDAAKAALASL